MRGGKISLRWRQNKRPINHSEEQKTTLFGKKTYWIANLRRVCGKIATNLPATVT